MSDGAGLLTVGAADYESVCVLLSTWVDVDACALAGASYENACREYHHLNSQGRPAMVPRPGDWVCPNPSCGDVQFAVYR